MLCPKCHNRIVKGSSFCHICGEPIPQQKVEKTILSRVKQKEEIKKEKKILEEELLNYEEETLIKEGKNIGKYIVINKIFFNKSTDYVTRLANKISERDSIICLFAIRFKEKANIILASSKNIENVNMGQIFREYISIVNGKGGGSKTLAQGVGEVDNIEEFLNNIYNFFC